MIEEEFKETVKQVVISYFKEKNRPVPSLEPECKDWSKDHNDLCYDKKNFERCKYDCMCSVNTNIFQMLLNSKILKTAATLVPDQISKEQWIKIIMKEAERLYAHVEEWDAVYTTLIEAAEPEIDVTEAKKYLGVTVRSILKG